MLAATLDPDGRRVVLDEEGWRHIRRRHPELHREMRDIMAAVHTPAIRRRGRTPDRAYYFAERASGLRWLQVVVHYEGEDGWIVMAFARSTLPRQ